MIVDDEKMGRKFLNRRLTRLFPQATVTEVASGEEALAKAATNQYDVITMDHFMAIDEINGDEAIRQLRSQLNTALWDALKEAGITIAFPQLDVHFDAPVVDSLRNLGRK